MSKLLSIINRVFRHVVPLRSKERYYSSGKWNDSWSHGYDLDRREEDARYGTLLALMRRYEKEGPLLDVGCGDGLLEEKYRQISSVPIVAFDYSASAIERARGRGLTNVEFLCADSRTFRPQQLFSVIVLNESLYYVDDYLIMMEALSKTLTPDGVFVVSMHATRLSKKIWNHIRASYISPQGVALKHEPTGCVWHVRLLQPRQRQEVRPKRPFWGVRMACPDVHCDKSFGPALPCVDMPSVGD
jgi:2-polyprenyl-3-methyl-5-hydroxy-6-metoxy-1,4-benzoquinol methylase